MARKYTIELDAREALVVRVALRKEMERRKGIPPLDPAWKGVSACAQSVIDKLRDPANVTEVDPIPVGLCGNRQDHEPHFHESTGLGLFYCHADQDKRVPFAMERKDR